jgi:hypothetical protein
MDPLKKRMAHGGLNRMKNLPDWLVIKTS